MIKTLDLFEELKNELITLLETLDASEWEKETCLMGRSVKDLASHIMDTSLRRVSMGKDKYFAETPGDFSHDGLVRFIQEQNRKWIGATRRISPRLLIELLKVSERELISHLEDLNPRGDALFPVAWAGEEKYSENWFDIAREYTEKWHHQMQIREVLGKEDKLYDRKLFRPIIEIFAVALPYTYNKYDGDNFIIEVEIGGESGDSYFIEKKDGTSKMIDRIECKNKVTILDKEFWKLVTNSKDRNKIKIQISGDENLCNHLLNMVTVMS